MTAADYIQEKIQWADFGFSETKKEKLTNNK